jgi:hypothetical protein
MTFSPQMADYNVFKTDTLLLRQDIHGDSTSSDGRRKHEAKLFLTDVSQKDG